MLGNPIRKVRFGWLVGVALALVPSMAGAQTNPAAEALFNSGREAMAKGDYEHACQQLRESNRLEPAVGTQFNLADCEEKRGKLATAWTLFRAVEQKVPEGDERASVARERAQALEGRLPKVTLRLAAGAPKETTVRDGDTELEAGSFGIPLPMDPGTHEFVVSAPGRSSQKIEITLADGEHRDVEVKPGEASGSSVPVERRSGAPPLDHPHGSNTKTLGFAIGGVGVAGVAVGAIAGAMVLGKKSTADENCPNKLCTSQAGLDAVDSARTLKLVSNIGWAVGVLGLGAGAYFVLTSSDGERTSVGAAALPAGGQLSVTRLW